MTNNSAPMEYQKAIHYIFQMIKDGKLIVGSKIPSERDLAETLSIGRNSTREAISILRGMGLVESVHGSGNYITKEAGHSIGNIISVMLSLGSISVKDLIQFRRVTEKTVIELIFKNGLSAEDKVNIERIVTEIEDIVNKTITASVEQLASLDHEFHVVLIRATRNPLFIMVMEAVAEVYEDSMAAVLGSSEDEALIKLGIIHRAIANSVISGDEDSCLRYINEHYDIVEKKLF